MTKTELEKKHLSELHLLASEAGVEKYRLLTKAELIDRLAEGNGDGGGAEEQTEERQERPRRRRRSSGTREPRERSDREPRERPEKAPEREPAPEPVAKTPEPAAKEERQEAAEPARPRRRRRRRFGRRKQGVTLQTLLLPPEAGRQALVFAESREGCTALLRGVAADLAADSKGPDPVALLIDPSPEELADWKREAPQAEIVSAGQPRHASDALAQAAARAGKGEDVILLVDSLTRLGEAYGDAEAAKEFFDAGREQGPAGGGSLTVVAALERPNGD
ncbi:MAG TPA: Rho termination factor N-terminal domain-containing protein [Solirubrobacterales bacterium]|nr:Rho termination factor N-terminal domain-containing protein [Solirubrobacterales bacterium]